MFFRKGKKSKTEKDDQTPGKSPREEEKLPLEKGDLPAMFLGAVIAIGPFFLVMIGTLLLFGWIFGAFR